MAEQNNLICDAVTRIPVWNGDGKDAFTAEQWLEHIEKARQAAGWDDATTMSFIYCSLRGEALLWYDHRSLFIGYTGFVHTIPKNVLFSHYGDVKTSFKN